MSGPKAPSAGPAAAPRPQRPDYAATLADRVHTMMLIERVERLSLPPPQRALRRELAVPPRLPRLLAPIASQVEASVLKALSESWPAYGLGAGVAVLLGLAVFLVLALH